MHHAQQASLALPLDPRSAARARRFLERTLAAWRCPDLVETAELLASELVTNAIRHAGTAVDLRVRLRDGRLRVEVRDRGAGQPRPRLPRPHGEAGRGLFLVDQLANDWGVRDEDDGGKTVWFVLEARALSRSGRAG